MQQYALGLVVLERLYLRRVKGKEEHVAEFC
jgi:hypothetical protein